MNSKQKVFVLIGMLGLIAIFIFPPWEFTTRNTTTPQFLGFSFLGSPPETGYRYKPNLAHSTIAIEILILIAISVGGVLVMKETTTPNSTNEPPPPINEIKHDTTTSTPRRQDAIEENEEQLSKIKTDDEIFWTKYGSFITLSVFFIVIAIALLARYWH
jgi:hypothetical protein